MALCVSVQMSTASAWTAGAPGAFHWDRSLAATAAPGAAAAAVGVGPSPTPESKLGLQLQVAGMALHDVRVLIPIFLSHGVDTIDDVMLLLRDDLVEMKLRIGLRNRTLDLIRRQRAIELKAKIRDANPWGTGWASGQSDCPPRCSEAPLFRDAAERVAYESAHGVW